MRPDYWMMTILLAGSLAACNTRADRQAVAPLPPETVEAPAAVETPAAQPVSPSVPSHGLTTHGKVKAARYADLYFRRQEQIARIYVKNGVRVRQGQRLAELDTTALCSELRQAEVSLVQAHLELQDILIGQGYDPDKVEVVPADVMRLAKVKSGYEQALLQRETARRELDAATLTAPFDGVVANLSAQPFHRAGSDTPFCRILSRQGMEVEFSVMENELHLVGMGRAVEIRPQAAGIGVRCGEICEMNPLVDERGLVTVRAGVKESAGLLDGMNVTVCIDGNQ